MELIERRKVDRALDFRIFKDANAVIAAFAAGQKILEPGVVNRAMYIVQKGVVAVHVEGVVVAQIPEGGIFGEMGLLDPEPHTASIVAMTDVEVSVIDEAQFINMIAKTPLFALRVMRVLASRVRAMNARPPQTAHAAA